MVFVPLIWIWSHMLKDVYTEILDKVNVSATDKFEALLTQSITIAIIPDYDPKPNLETISFKFGKLLDGLERFSKHSDMEKALIHGTDTLLAILDGLQFKVDESEAFLLYQLRKLGKFRKREKDLLDELKKLWKIFPQYELTDGEFSASLKSLMREKLILYRKGTIQINLSFVVRYHID